MFKAERNSVTSVFPNYKWHLLSKEVQVLAIPLMHRLGTNVAVCNIALLRLQGQIPLQVMPLQGSDLTQWALSWGLAEVSEGPCGVHCGNKLQM